MSVLDIVSGLSKAAGQGYAGYGEDQQIKVKDALAQAKAAEEAQRNAVLNRVSLAGIDPKNRGAIAGAEATAKVPAAVEEFKQKTPLEIVRAKGAAEAVAPVQQATHLANRKADVANPLPVAPNFSAQTVGGVDGQPGKVLTYDTHSGTPGPVLGDAKPSAATTKLTDPQEKSYLFYNLMKNAEPEITKTLGSGRIRPAAVSAYLAAGQAGDMPIIGKAVGALAKPMANDNLNADEQQLIRAGKDFTAGVLRKESGAAVTASELMETMERYFPGMFGDKPGLTDAKTLARQQYMQTMEQEAMPAIQYYGRQSKPGTPAAGADDFTDAEVLAAHVAGKRTDADIAAWIKARRGGG